jgi:hypothetical protein
MRKKKCEMFALILTNECLKERLMIVLVMNRVERHYE